jgi:molecular chaperone GrpE
MSEDSNREQPGFQVSDRRFWVQDESIVDRATLTEVKYPSFVEELKARTEAAEQKLRERLDHLDKENAAYRERLERLVEQRVDRVKAALLLDYLEIADNLERALEAASAPEAFDALREGVALNLGLLLSKLRAAGVEPIETLQVPFDPAQAEAVGIIPVEDPGQDGLVLEQLQKGYRLNEQVLRPARVRVGKLA